MGGTRNGGRQAAATNKKRYGDNFYPIIGKLGGQKSRGGGFAKDPELAREAGRLGGLATKNSLSQLQRVVTNARKRGLSDVEIYEEMLKSKSKYARAFVAEYMRKH